MVAARFKPWDTAYFIAMVLAASFAFSATPLSASLFGVASVSALIEFRKTDRRIPQVVAIVGFMATAYMLFALLVQGR